MSYLTRDAGREKPLFASPSWSEWWSHAVGLSVFSGILVTALGDVFFRLRVALAGGRWLGNQRLTRTYLSLAQIGALPALLCRLGETCYFATPMDAAQSSWPAIVVTAVFGIWGQVGEYRATIMAFQAPPLRARIVFFWLPIFILVAVVALLEVLG